MIIGPTRKTKKKRKKGKEKDYTSKFVAILE